MKRTFPSRLTPIALVSMTLWGGAGCQEAAPPKTASAPAPIARPSAPAKEDEASSNSSAIASTPTAAEPASKPESPVIEEPVIPAPQPEPIAASLEASALSRLFQSTDSAEAERLLGKRVELIGYVLQVRNLGNQRLVVLGDEHFTTELPAERVLCHIEEEMGSESGLAGPRLRVTGTCQLGYGNLVVLRDCTLEETLPALEGFEERKAAFAETQNLEALKKLGVEIAAEEQGKAAIITQSQLRGGRIEKDVLDRLAQLGDVTILRLSGLSITDEGLREIPFLKDLREITLDATRVSAEGLAALANSQNLRRIALDGTTEDEGFAHLAGCRNLESLEIISSQGASQFSEKAAESLSQIEGLVRLRLDGARLSPMVMQWIGRQSGLQALSLEYSTLTPELLQPLHSLKKLHTLSVSGSRFGDDSLATLAAFSHLRELDLSHTGVSDAGLAVLAGLKELQSLDLSGCRIAGGGLRNLKGLPLEKLSLWGSQADNEALIEIETLTSLRSLRLGHTRIGSSALGRLNPLQNLEHLDLSGIRLNRDALPVLEALSSLKELRLAENPFEDCESCLADLAQARPGLHLYLGRYDYWAQLGAAAGE